jgi:hypothetical protein
MSEQEQAESVADAIWSQIQESHTTIALVAEKSAKKEGAKRLQQSLLGVIRGCRAGADRATRPVRRHGGHTVAYSVGKAIAWRFPSITLIDCVNDGGGGVAP